LLPGGEQPGAVPLPGMLPGCLGWDEGAGLVRCLVENTLGLGRYLGWCRVDGGCLSCDGGTVVPLLDDVNPGAVPLPGEVPVVLGLHQLMAQYHSRFSQARICYLVDVDPGAEPLPGLGWLVG